MNNNVLNYIFEKDVSATSKLVFLAIFKYCGTKNISYPSLQLLCEDCKLTINTIRTAIKELEENKILKIEKKQIGKGNFKSNVFIFLDFIVSKIDNITDNINDSINDNTIVNTIDNTIDNTIVNTIDMSKFDTEYMNNRNNENKNNRNSEFINKQKNEQKNSQEKLDDFITYEVCKQIYQKANCFDFDLTSFFLFYKDKGIKKENVEHLMIEWDSRKKRTHNNMQQLKDNLNWKSNFNKNTKIDSLEKFEFWWKWWDNNDDEEMDNWIKEKNVNAEVLTKNYESLINYCESKGKVYKNYKSALKNFILLDLNKWSQK